MNDSESHPISIMNALKKLICKGRNVKICRESAAPKQLIYMSEYTDGTIVCCGVSAQRLNFLEKPFSPEGLARKVLDK